MKLLSRIVTLRESGISTDAEKRVRCALTTRSCRTTCRERRIWTSALPPIGLTAILPTDTRRVPSRIRLCTRTPRLPTTVSGRFERGPITSFR